MIVAELNPPAGPFLAALHGHRCRYERGGASQRLRIAASSFSPWRVRPYIGRNSASLRSN